MLEVFSPVLAALTWDPQIRGASIVLAGIFMLIGSVYLLLATNMGAKLGLVLAIAGLTGWMGTMGAVWLVFGIGLIGSGPEWKVVDVVTGPAAQSTAEVMDEFPIGFTRLVTGDAGLADAASAADRVLAPSAEPEGGHGEEEGGGGGEEAEKFESPFRTTEDYVLLNGYAKGGETYFLTLRHRPHYTVVQVKPSFFPDGTPPGLKPQPDFSGPTTSVVMIRDLGNLRFPPFMFMFTSFTIFGVACYSLHTRDKEIMAAKAAAAAAASAPTADAPVSS